MRWSSLLPSVFAGWALAASRTSPPAGALVVGSGQKYTTIGAAVNALSKTSTASQTIFIEAGTYKEQVYIPALAGPLIVEGYTADTSSYSGNKVTISSGISLTTASNDDMTATLRNYAANSKVYNINIENTYGKGSQALALSAYAGNQGYYGCQFLGYQDTVLAQTGAQVYAKSLIVGAVDFIFGQHATAWFDGVDIQVIGGQSPGTITANGRASASDASYYVINKSTVSARSGTSVASGSYYLGRPWSQYARVVFQDTSLSQVINAAGWEVWQTSDPRTSNVLFGEYGNSGEGASGTRASFATKLSAPVGITTILGSGYKSWVDTTYLS